MTDPSWPACPTCGVTPAFAQTRRWSHPPQTPNLKPQTRDTNPQTQNPKPQNPSAKCVAGLTHPKPRTSNPKSSPRRVAGRNPRTRTPNPKHETPNPKPQTPEPFAQTRRWSHPPQTPNLKNPNSSPQRVAGRTCEPRTPKPQTELVCRVPGFRSASLVEPAHPNPKPEIQHPENPSPQRVAGRTRVPNPGTTRTREPQTPNTRHETPNPKYQTPSPEPQTPNPEPQTSNPKPQTPNPETSNPKPSQNPKPGTRNPYQVKRHARWDPSGIGARPQGRSLTIKAWWSNFAPQGAARAVSVSPPLPIMPPPPVHGRHDLYAPNTLSTLEGVV